MSHPKTDAPAGPEHSHYVSLENHAIYPALTSPAGYEDMHPTEYRPATPQEILRYQRGDQNAAVDAAAVVELSALGNIAPEPTVITLAPEAPPAPPADDVPPPPPALIEG